VPRPRAYRDADHLEDILRERPAFGPEPTEQDRYWDSGPIPGWAAEGEDVPFLDQDDDREREL